MDFWILNFSPKPLTGADFRIIIGNPECGEKRFPVAYQTFQSFRAGVATPFQLT